MVGRGARGGRAEKESERARARESERKREREREASEPCVGEAGGGGRLCVQGTLFIRNCHPP